MSKGRRILLIAGVLCTLVVGGVIVVNGQIEQNTSIDGQHAISQKLNNAVSLAVKSRSGTYAVAETATEGHIILDTEEEGKTIKVYCIASYGAFGFENGIFSKVSGCGAVPTTITFSQNKTGEYSLLQYTEPMDGEANQDSIKKMFPSGLHAKALHAGEYYSYLAKQQEAQAAEYLQSIGRKAKVSADPVQRKSLDIDVQSSNKLLSQLAKSSSLINNCPSWIGTREQLENGERYIYETSQSKTSDGYDLITFRKTKVNGTVVEEDNYKIIGTEPQHLDS